MLASSAKSNVQFIDIEPGALKNFLQTFNANGHSVSAGFPSPAEDFLPPNLDLNTYLIQNPDSTFFVRVSGDSMIGAGINDGDVLIVDRSLEPIDGKVVIACLDGDLFVKRLQLIENQYYLTSDNSKYKPVKITEELEVEFWGVVIHVVHKI